MSNDNNHLHAYSWFLKGFDRIFRPKLYKIRHDQELDWDNQEYNKHQQLVRQLFHRLEVVEKNFTEFDLNQPVYVHSYSRKFFGNIKLSFHNYVAELAYKDIDKAEEIIAGLEELVQTKNSDKLKAALHRHRHACSFGLTTGEKIYNQMWLLNAQTMEIAKLNPNKKTNLEKKKLIKLN